MSVLTSPHPEYLFVYYLFPLLDPKLLHSGEFCLCVSLWYPQWPQQWVVHEGYTPNLCNEKWSWLMNFFCFFCLCCFFCIECFLQELAWFQLQITEKTAYFSLQKQIETNFECGQYSIIKTSQPMGKTNLLSEGKQIPYFWLPSCHYLLCQNSQIYLYLSILPPPPGVSF